MMPSSNEVRKARIQATRLGLRLEQRGNVFHLFDEAGQKVHAGSLASATGLLVKWAKPWRPGPARAIVPPSWAPAIAALTAELLAARRSPGTIRTREKCLAKFAIAHPGSDPLTVTREDLIAYLSSDEWAPRYVHSIRTTFRVFFTLLVERELRIDNPAAKLPHVRVPRSLPRPCPDAAIREAYANADERVRLALRLAGEAGLRRAEVAGLRRSDVEGWAGAYSLRIIGKGGHERLVPIGDDLAADVLAKDTEYVFPSVDTWGNAIGPHLTPHHLGKLMSEALPDKWTAHTLRHRFGTKAYQRSSDIRAVQELLGHHSPATTAIYTEVSDDSRRRAAEAARI